MLCLDFLASLIVAPGVHSIVYHQTNLSGHYPDFSSQNYYCDYEHHQTAREKDESRLCVVSTNAA